MASRGRVRLPSNTQLPVQVGSNAEVMYCPFFVIPVLPSQLSRFIPCGAPMKPDHVLRLAADRSTTTDEVHYSAHHTDND